MPVDRTLYGDTAAITKAGAPNWPCPRCKGGHFRLKPETLHGEWTADTRDASKELAFEASWVKQIFVAILKCDNEKCGEVASLAGIGKVNEWPDDDMTKMLYEDEFNPTYFLPSPQVISVPGNCPADVVSELEHAFIALWGDPASAGNRIRKAVERLMDALRVPKTSLNKAGNRQPLALHARIVKIKSRYPGAHDALLAIKWLGNAGSHAAELNRDGVFDALDIFESVLNDLYSKHPSAIKRLVKSVNARKGPIQKRTARKP